jgi:hypothetical protein
VTVVAVRLNILLWPDNKISPVIMLGCNALSLSGLMLLYK